MNRISLVALISFVVPNLAFADEAKAPPPPPEVKQTLNIFSGNWSGDLQFTPPGAPAPLKFKGGFDCKAIVGGTALHCSLRASEKSLGKLEEEDLIGYDPETKHVRIMTWNNLGEIHDHQAVLKDAKTVEGTFAGTVGGKPLEEQFAWNLVSPKKMSFKFTQKGPEGSCVFEGTLTRK